MIGISGQNEAAVLSKEEGLSRELSTRPMAMIAIGGAIGTGLFLGSSLAVHTAGPAVLIFFPYVCRSGKTRLPSQSKPSKGTSAT